MNLVFFSHSYRKDDAVFVDYFGRLLRNEGLVPSLDPPSEGLNSAKLERHLLSCDGMIAVLSWRDGGPSQYILYEIGLCVRARKPLLVFVEDVLPDHAIPPRVLQRRFSRRFFLRQMREHRHAVQILKTYMGEQPPPKYQPAVGKKICLLAGLAHLPKGNRDLVEEVVSDRGYTAASFDSLAPSQVQDMGIHETMSSIDVALCCVDELTWPTQYLLGVVHTGFIPAISFTTHDAHEYHPQIPRECQAAVAEAADLTLFRQTLDSQFELFEEDFVELENVKEVQTYASMLFDLPTQPGQYGERTRTSMIKELIMGDKYTVGQAGAVGPHSHAHDMTFTQVWNQAGSDIDLDELTTELSVLRAKMKEEATQPEHDAAVGEAASAEVAAKNGDGPKALEHLQNAGQWALEVALKVGVPVAIAALKTALGV